MTTNPSSTHNEDIEKIRRERDRLEAENAQLKAILKTEGKLGLWLGKLGYHVALGNDLTSSIQSWLDAWGEQGRPSNQENAEVIGAFVRRYLIRVSIIGLIAIIPTVLTLFFLWQQNSLIQNQVQQQTRLNDINRRAQLLATLYDRTDCVAENREECPVQASIRARIEAAQAFADIERVTGNRPNLGEVELSGGDLSGAILTGTILIRAKLISVTSVLSKANLSESNLFRANLSGADLKEVNLSRADLFGADLRGADLRGANLSKANLKEVNLSGANLFGADLRGADLRGTNLSESNLSWPYTSFAYPRWTYRSWSYTTRAQYNNATIWPDDFDPKAAGAINVDEEGE